MGAGRLALKVKYGIQLSKEQNSDQLRNIIYILLICAVFISCKKDKGVTQQAVLTPALNYRQEFVGEYSGPLSSISQTCASSTKAVFVTTTCTPIFTVVVDSHAIRNVSLHPTNDSAVIIDQGHFKLHANGKLNPLYSPIGSGYSHIRNDSLFFFAAEASIKLSTYGGVTVWVYPSKSFTGKKN